MNRENAVSVSLIVLWFSLQVAHLLASVREKQKNKKISTKLQVLVQSGKFSLTQKILTATLGSS